MLLVVGLGNPGLEYRNTRHNVGFSLLHSLAAKYNANFLYKAKFKSNIACITLEDKKILLVCPETYMNLSGDAVLALTNFYKLDISDIIVIHDDVDLNLNRVKVKIGGSAGGHNGLKSIDSRIGNKYLRLRIGIGRPKKNVVGADHVLENFSGDEKLHVEQVTKNIIESFSILIKKDLDLFSSKINQS